jgi:hypothetical protein
VDPVNLTRVQSRGSLWVLDEDLLRYCRFPLNEAPRERPEWGSADAGALQDAVWHPYVSWRLSDHPVSIGGRYHAPDAMPLLVIDLGDDDGNRVAAPNARLLT